MTINPADVRRAHAAWTGAELADNVAAVMRTAIDRSVELSEQCRAEIEAPNPVPGALARGDLEGRAAIEAQRTKPLLPHQREQVYKLSRDAQQHVLAQLVVDVRALDPFESLRTAHDEVITEANELVALVDGIDSDTKAVAAAPKQREAWVKVTALAARRAHLLEVRRRFYRIGVFRVARLSPDAPAQADCFEHPELVPRGAGLGLNARALADCIAAGAQPAFVSYDELVERWPYKSKLRPQQPRPKLLEAQRAQPDEPEHTDDGTAAVRHTLA